MTVPKQRLELYGQDWLSKEKNLSSAGFALFSYIYKKRDAVDEIGDIKLVVN